MLLGSAARGCRPLHAASWLAFSSNITLHPTTALQNAYQTAEVLAALHGVGRNRVRCWLRVPCPAAGAGILLLPSCLFIAMSPCPPPPDQAASYAHRNPCLSLPQAQIVPEFSFLDARGVGELERLPVSEVAAALEAGDSLAPTWCASVHIVCCA